MIERRESLHVEKKELEALLGHAQDESPEESHIKDFGETTRIPLTQGQVALVDAADLPLLAPYRWTAIRSGHTWYAKAHVGNRTIYMHRLIVFGDDADNAPFKVDHTNRNGLDNRRHNLRSVTHSRNLMNSVGKPSTRKSHFKGVSLCKRPSKPYRATIHVNRKQRHPGYFASEREAAQAYDSAAREEFGPHARINFPNDSRRPPFITLRICESTTRRFCKWACFFLSRRASNA